MIERDFVPFNILRSLRLTFSQDWVELEPRRKERVIDETEHAKRVQPNVYYAFKNARTGEVREFRKTAYGSQWKLKGEDHD